MRIARVTACALLLLSAAIANAVDWGDLALRSIRSDDALLVEALQESDLGEALRMCEAVGLRRDPFAGSIIEAVASARSGRGGGASVLRSETLLRALLAKLLDPERAEPPLAERVRVNAGQLETLLDGIARVQDPQLAAALVRIVPLLDGSAGPRALMAVGNRIVFELRRGEGRLVPMETSLALDYLSAVRQAADSDFLPQCALIARLSTDDPVVKAARAAAFALSGPG